MSHLPHNRFLIYFYSSSFKPFIINSSSFWQLRKEIIQFKNKRFTAYSDEELEKLIENFKCNWHNAVTDKEKNQLLKTIVKKIYYNREGNTVTFEIEYL